tara:strand:- start:3144 stop:3272 length:129 start_codon:yes stop_codon:yes gene_type:complete
MSSILKRDGKSRQAGVVLRKPDTKQRNVNPFDKTFVKKIEKV